MTDNEDTIKLVIADDHTLFRDALIEYIKRSNLNAELVVLKSFDEAYEYLETDNEQDLVILDLRMPGMNGLQGFKTLKEGELVDYEEGSGEKGPCATNVVPK